MPGGVPDDTMRGRGAECTVYNHAYLVLASLQAPQNSQEVPALDGEADLPPLKTPKALKFLGQKVYLKPKSM